MGHPTAPLSFAEKLSVFSGPIMDQISRGYYGLCGWVLDAGTGLLEARQVKGTARLRSEATVCRVVLCSCVQSSTVFVSPHGFRLSGGASKAVPVSILPCPGAATRRSRSNAPHDFHAISSCDGKPRGHLIQCRSVGLASAPPP
jgi:hypothetical protein